MGSHDDDNDDRPATHAGYVAHATYKPTGALIVLYIAAEQGIDVDGSRYAVVCRLHSTIIGETSKRSARRSMRRPEFCEDCMGIDDTQKSYCVEAEGC